MARIAGVDLQDKWRVVYALTRIKGIGWTLSKKIMATLKWEETKRVSDLTPADISGLSSEMEKYPTEGDLLRTVRASVARLQATSSYRGTRHKRGLPVRGQRTKSNARTKRGKRKTVGAFKKEALSKQTQVTK
jgi:small subunit ribosomal protein S13